MVQLDGKTVLLTGAAGGQGQVAARLLCEAGARVYGTDRLDGEGETLEKTLRESGLDFTFLPADLTRSSDIEQLIERIDNEAGSLDVLYNNHGILLPRPFLETTDEDWDRVHNTNLKSVFKVIRATAPLMNRGGSIINVGSIASLVALPDMAAYVASKTGLIGLTKAAAVDLAPRGIRVNAICPGVVDTEMSRGVAATAQDPEVAWEAYQAAHLVGRVGRAEEIVSLALYLASDDSTFITGASIAVDGGWSVQ